MGMGLYIQFEDNPSSNRNPQNPWIIVQGFWKFDCTLEVSKSKATHLNVFRGPIETVLSGFGLRSLLYVTKKTIKKMSRLESNSSWLWDFVFLVCSSNTRHVLMFVYTILFLRLLWTRSTSFRSDWIQYTTRTYKTVVLESMKVHTSI